MLSGCGLGEVEKNGSTKQDSGQTKESGLQMVASLQPESAP